MKLMAMIIVNKDSDFLCDCLSFTFGYDEKYF